MAAAQCKELVRCNSNCEMEEDNSKLFKNQLNYVFENARFFVINSENVLQSQQNSTCFIRANDVLVLDEAYRSASNVMLIFAERPSMQLYGFALMNSNVVASEGNCGQIDLLWMCKTKIMVECELFFNNWDTSFSSLQEIKPSVAFDLCYLFPEDNQLDLISFRYYLQHHYEQKMIKSEFSRTNLLLQKLQEKISEKNNSVSLKYIKTERKLLHTINSLIDSELNNDSALSEEYDQEDQCRWKNGKKANVLLGAVSFKNGHHGHFYLILCSRKLEMLTSLGIDSLNFPLKEIPNVGDIVTVYLMKTFFRAIVISKLLEVNKISFFLMDTGAFKLFSLDDVKMYKLPQKYEFEGLAKLCRTESHTTSLMQYISNNFYKLHKTLVVNSECVPYEVKLFSTNPFFADLFDNVVNKKDKENSTALQPFEEPAPVNESENEQIDLEKTTKLSYHQTEEVNEDSRSETSEENFDELFEELEEHTNPLMAVTGYIQKDDVRLCPYTRSTGDCFKGYSCKLQHKKKNEDGITKDTIPTIIEIPLKKSIPLVDQFISVVPTQVIRRSNMFYGIILESDLIELNKLTVFMNRNDVISTYKSIPINDIVPLQLVAAKFDGIWYRGQVRHIFDNDRVEIFYVDYGNNRNVQISDVRQWDTAFETVPFQALLFRIANVQVSKENEKKTFEEMSKHVNKTIHCYVELSDYSGINVICTDTFGRNIGLEIDGNSDAETKRFRLIPKYNFLPV